MAVNYVTLSGLRKDFNHPINVGLAPIGVQNLFKHCYIVVNECNCNSRSFLSSGRQTRSSLIKIVLLTIGRI